MRKLFSLFAALTLSVGLWADEVIQYTATTSLQELFSDPEKFQPEPMSNDYDEETNTGTVIFPDLIEIRDNAFQDCSALTSITLPASIQRIGSGAFANCENLQSVTCKASQPPTCDGNTFENVHPEIILFVPALSLDAYQIWGGFFYNILPIPIEVGDQFKDEATGLYFEITSLETPKTVKVVSSSMFMYSNSSYNIPSSVICSDVEYTVTEIGNDAFYNCGEVTSITLPSTITTIGADAFCFCVFSSIDLPAALTAIGSYAFLDCKNLQSIIVPANITTIDYNAFDGCTALQEVTFLGNACQNGIGDYVFNKVGATTPALLTLPDNWTGTLPDEDGKWYGGKFEMSSIPGLTTYLDENGEEQEIVAAEVESATTQVTWGTAGQTTWYVVKGTNVQLSKGAICAGDVRLILADGAKLTAEGEGAGIAVMGVNSLTIYGQSTGDEMGQLIANGGDFAAGIGGGGYGGNGSNITINGGEVTATGGDNASGIGGGANAFGSNIFVATSLQVKADGNFPPTTVIAATRTATTDIANDLAGKQYVTIEPLTPSVIRFNSCGGSAIESIEGTTIPGTLPTPTYPCTAESFGGWYFDMDYTQPATAGTAITQDTILYAKWTYSYYGALRYGIFLGGSRMATGTHSMGSGTYTLVEDGMGNATLTLNNATISQQLIAFAENLTIVMHGENVVNTNNYESPYNEGAIVAQYGADLTIEGDGQINMEKAGYGSLQYHAIDVRGYDGNTDHNVAPGCLTINSGKFFIRGYWFPIFIGATQGFRYATSTHVGYTGNESTLIINGGVFDIDSYNTFCAVECIGGVATFNGGVFKAQAYDQGGRIAEAFMANKTPDYGGNPKTVLNNAAHMLVFGGDNEATSAAITITGDQMPTTRFLQITDQSVLDVKATNCAFSQTNPLTPVECIPSTGGTFTQDAEFGIMDVDDYRLPDEIHFELYNRETKETTTLNFTNGTEYTYDPATGDIVVFAATLNNYIGNCLVVKADGVPFPYVIKDGDVEIVKENSGTYKWSKYKDATHTGASYRSTNQHQANSEAVSNFTFNPAKGLGAYSISFDYQVSSEANDRMYVYVNDNVISDINGISGTASGHIDVLCTDTTVLKTRYAKDYSGDWGDDCGYIYNLHVTDYGEAVFNVVTVQNTEGGSVTGLAPGGYYIQSTEATLTATPYTACEFKQWENKHGDVLSTDMTFTFTVTQDTTIVPIFEVEQRIFEIATGVTAQMGTLNKNLPWIKTTAKPGLAYMSATGHDDQDSRDTLIITPADGVYYRLTFDYAVSSESGWDKMSIWSNGNIVANEISGTASGSYDSKVAFLAESKPDTIILSYHKDGSYGYGDDRGYIYNIQVQAYNTPPAIYTVNVLENTEGVVSGLATEGKYLEGEAVSLTAIPNNLGFELKEWQDGNGNQISTDNPFTFTITQDTTIKPIYQVEQRSYEIATGVTAQMGTLDKDYPWAKTTAKPGLAYRSTNYHVGYQQSRDTLIITPNEGVLYRLKFDYAVSSEGCCDKLSVWVNGEKINEIGGETSGSYDSGETPLTGPDTIVMSFYNDDDWFVGEDRGYIYNIVVTSDAPYPVYTRDVTDGSWGTICLPWESTKLEGGDFYDVLGTKHAEYGVALVELGESDQLTAGKPYVFKATSEQIKVTYDPATEVEDEVEGNNIIGSFAGCPVPNGMYIIYNNLLYITDGSSTIGTNRAYFDVASMEAYNPATAPARVVFFGGRQAPTDNNTIHHPQSTIHKVLKDGQFVIIKDNKMYNAQGIEL